MTKRTRDPVADEQAAQPSLSQVIDEWKPGKLPHCSNCINARVHGEPETPMAYCRKGHGKQRKADDGQAVELSRLIRHKSPLGFKVAAECPDWEAAG